MRVTADDNVAVVKTLVGHNTEAWASNQAVCSRTTVAEAVAKGQAQLTDSPIHDFTSNPEIL